MFFVSPKFLFIERAVILKIRVSLASKFVKKHFLSQEGLRAFIVV